MSHRTGVWSPINRIVVQNNWVYTQGKALKSNPCQEEVNFEAEWIVVFDSSVTNVNPLRPTTELYRKFYKKETNAKMVKT